MTCQVQGVSRPAQSRISPQFFLGDSSRRGFYSSDGGFGIGRRFACRASGDGSRSSGPRTDAIGPRGRWIADRRFSRGGFRLNRTDPRNPKSRNHGFSRKAPGTFTTVNDARTLHRRHRISHAVSGRAHDEGVVAAVGRATRGGNGRGREGLAAVEAGEPAAAIGCAIDSGFGRPGATAIGRAGSRSEASGFRCIARAAMRSGPISISLARLPRRFTFAPERNSNPALPMVRNPEKSPKTELSGSAPSDRTVLNSRRRFRSTGGVGTSSVRRRNSWAEDSRKRLAPPTKKCDRVRVAAEKCFSRVSAGCARGFSTAPRRPFVSLRPNHALAAQGRCDGSDSRSRYRYPRSAPAGVPEARSACLCNRHQGGH